MNNVVQLIWAVLPSLIVSIVLSRWNYLQNKKMKKEEQEKEEKLEKEIAQLNLILATAQLSYACAIALKRGTTNGETETAIEQYNKAINQFRELERKHIVEEGLV